ncbi:HAD family hydrolase [Cohnella thailandensis]|uniref:HAD family hydrolase n=1 Tax=Cohnella thailandensis TaxID=557557 RepID=A0A841SVV9_9BACL|nr:HAD family hydrolase [Cohnella thailandensis]MBB6634746.1 HAD family hydrolase [Cohnella thailandensis]MBP1977849.1 HAD superfamily hydrolase (TIGR01509 family) [Cohnella thailandensis]
MIRAIVFDFDGTIMDTESVAYDAFRGIFNEYGLELSLAKWAKGIGTWGAYDPYKDLEEQTGLLLNREELNRQYEMSFAEKVKNVEVRPGVVAVLEEASRRGFGLALATSSYRKNVIPHLEEKGLLHYFQAIHTADEVEKVKPDPALYKLAIASLKVRPEEAVAIEDSVNGLRAAKAAGLFGLAVPNELTAFMDFSEADLTIPTSLAQLPFDEWMGRLHKQGAPKPARG